MQSQPLGLGLVIKKFRLELSHSLFNTPQLVSGFFILGALKVTLLRKMLSVTLTMLE